MANPVLSVTLVSIIVISLPALGTSISSCNGPCQTLNDCDGQLICISGRCGDDPEVGTHICSGGDCNPLPYLVCGKKAYTCSPPVSGSTSAILTNNDFSAGGDGGGPSECDNAYHSNTEKIVALSTGWYDGGSRCGRMIRITAQNGRTTTAKVVDECDSRNGCDAEHAYQPPCDNNIVDASNAVWYALGLNIDDGRVPITWSMA